MNVATSHPLPTFTVPVTDTRPYAPLPPPPPSRERRGSGHSESGVVGADGRLYFSSLWPPAPTPGQPLPHTGHNTTGAIYRTNETNANTAWHPISPQASSVRKADLHHYPQHA
ncbi:hypothetical protein Pcinc_020492 [Petrolisthes cinctipes]|uniref:Uncharacterized protein n=1 Tax=Petrolisthes cinctipes TaxID=88211 RepID=A0AAE1KLC2_PETCI|nr:hypothetical protein Pcinc_020492 [Petrolisthes cinctipes]